MGHTLTFSRFYDHYGEIVLLYPLDSMHLCHDGTYEAVEPCRWGFELAKSSVTIDYTCAPCWMSQRGSLKKVGKRVGTMNWLKVLFAGTVLLAAAPRAMGANVENKERAARKACMLGEVSKGVEILTDLFLDTSDVTYIYNQGRCFEQNGKNDQAVLRFKEYLRKAENLKMADRDAVQKKIDELQGAIDSHEAHSALALSSDSASRPTTVLVPSPLPASPAPAAATTDYPGLSVSSLPPAHEESPPVYKRWWFWTGVGALVAGGVVAGVLLGRKSAPQSPACDGLGTCVH